MRIGLSILLLGILVYICDPRSTWQYIRQASLPQLAGTLLLFLASMPLIAWRWQILLKAKGMRISLMRLTRYYIVGFFFNNFMPSSIGGDITRILNVSDHGYSLSDSFSCVFVERLIGFLAMALLAIGSLGFLLSHFQGAPLVIIITITLSFAFIILAWCCFHPAAFQRISVFLKRLRWKKLGDKLHTVYSAIHAYRACPRALLQTFAISLLYQFVMGVFVFWVARATGLTAPFWMLFALMQVSSMAGILPITLESAGIREGIFLVILVNLGYTDSMVLAAIIMVRIISIIGSSFGGVFLLAGDMHLPLSGRTSGEAAS